MPRLGDVYVAGYVLDCKRLVRELEELAMEPGKYSHELRLKFTELAGLAAQGSAAAFVEQMGERMK